MMRWPWDIPLVVWSARDLMRQPVLALILFVALAALSMTVTLVLHLDRALSSACTRLLQQAPSIVIRRINAGGWAPMDEGSAAAQAAEVAGVINPRGRIWGVARTDQGPVTIVGLREEYVAFDLNGAPRPERGQALVGPGIAFHPDAPLLRLGAAHTITVNVVGQLSRQSASAIHDAVLLHQEDARVVLGLQPHQVSDLVLDVFHDAEAEALISELSRRFGGQVSITTRQAQRNRYLADIAQRSGIALAALAPAALGMVLLVLATGVWGHQQKREMGLLKAVGWTGAEILRVQIIRGLLIGCPAVILGQAGAYALLFSPGVTWISRLLFGWTGASPALYLSPQGAFGNFILGALMIGLPFLAAVFWTAWQLAVADPAESIEGGP